MPSGTGTITRSVAPLGWPTRCAPSKSITPRPRACVERDPGGAAQRRILGVDADLTLAISHTELAADIVVRRVLQACFCIILANALPGAPLVETDADLKNTAAV